ncbi:MAG: zinc-ribbon domain-containing protein, partial [Candidatus Marinimicrobia bacterium]|nr:zinc-ribbon domain-containing protein [Candidatus Neomarinimicrobiota bacterium]
FEKKINDVFVDIFIEEINLIIEYDGAFFHKGQFQKDKLKRKSLIKDGYSLINIRVSPLRKIFKDDITINSKDNRSFLLISKILNKIINSGIINDKAIIFKANKYLKIGSIQNEKYFYDLTSKFPAPSPGSTLYDKFPNLKDEWHPTKNGEMTIHDYTYASHTKVWWQCKYGHEWQAQIARRYFGNNCPYCCGQKVGYGNDLKSKYPKIATLWHPTKNGSISTSDVMPGSHKKYWWKCSFGHVWEERIDSMVKKQDCLYCKNPNYKRNFHVFINNKKVGEWTSKAQCAKDLGLKSKGNISSCLNKKLNSYMGYTFEYKQNNDT